MKKDLTEIVFILDGSGSMCGLEKDTMGGFNSFIEEQKNTDGEAKVTTVLFSNYNRIRNIHDARDIKDIRPLTSNEYKLGGMTALMDAIGSTIINIGERLANTPEEEKPSKVIFVITTDGLENDSREFNREKVKELIAHQTNKYNWQFMFLGANIDSANEAESIGIDSQYASNYTANSIGTESLYRGLSKSVLNYRSNGVVEENWSEDIK